MEIDLVSEIAKLMNTQQLGRRALKATTGDLFFPVERMYKFREDRYVRDNDQFANAMAMQNYTETDPRIQALKRMMQGTQEAEAR